MKEKAVIFDFFGVISSRVSIPWLENNFPKDQVSNIEKKYVRAAYAGEISENIFFTEMERLTDRKAELIREEWSNLSKINNEVVMLIEELKIQHSIGLCTDAFTPFIKELLSRNNLTNLFDQIIISSEVKLLKPGKEIFKLTIKKLGTNPENAIFIDDQQKNVSGAEAIGVKGVLYSDIGELRKVLKELGYL